MLINNCLNFIEPDVHDGFDHIFGFWFGSDIYVYQRSPGNSQ